MKYWKVYAQCCIAPNPVKEISRRDAEEFIVIELYTNDSFDVSAFGEVDWDDDATVNAAYEKACEAALAYFDKNGTFGCGDFEIIRSDEKPGRPNVCGNDVSLI